ncbi:calcium-activated chloride channel regulator 1-like [Amphiura filiformis]|uniref:calcium-activated chloride channel regulator 1-like n=1 Tax=Amphiura filiformis TaxID=82378 RepID=UPI003B21682A
MLVVAGGEENSSPSISDIIHLLDDYQITVDTIAIGPEADKDLESLTRGTGGQSFYHSGSSSTLDEAFKAFSERNRDPRDALITVFTKSVQLARAQSDTSNVIIDASIGGDTQFLFDYSQGDASIEGTLILPDGTTITKTDSEYVTDTDFSLARITIAGQATAGQWQLNLMNTSPSPQNVTIIVQSRARKDGSGNQVDPIRATATWGKDSVSIMGDTVETNNQTIFVTVSKGYVPVLNAGVTATVSVPGGDIQPFAVNDDGLGADIQKNDGIYSAFLTKFKGEGRYGLSVMVENTGNTAILSPATVLGQGSIIHPDDEQVWSETPAGEFQRVVNGGSFSCEGVFCAVSTYEIRSSKGNINILYDNFVIADLVTTIAGNNLARSKESFTVPGLDIGPHSYFFAIVAIDDSSHRSLVSNIASASMRFIPLPPGISPWTEPPTPTTKLNGDYFLTAPMVRVVHVSKTSIYISWTDPEFSNGIIKYSVQGKIIDKPYNPMFSPSTDFEFHDEVDSLQRTFNVNNLQPSTKYEIQVAAISDVGRSDPAIITQSTDPVTEQDISTPSSLQEIRSDQVSTSTVEIEIPHSSSEFVR